MTTIEVHGLKFAIEPHGLNDGSTSFASAVHNIRQQLLALTPTNVASLHRFGLTPARGDPGNSFALEALAMIADEVSGLPDGQYVAVRPIAP